MFYLFGIISFDNKLYDMVKISYLQDSQTVNNYNFTFNIVPFVTLTAIATIFDPSLIKIK